MRTETDWTRYYAAPEQAQKQTDPQGIPAATARHSMRRRHVPHRWTPAVAVCLALLALIVALSALTARAPVKGKPSPVTTVCVHVNHHKHPVSVTKPVGGMCPPGSMEYLVP